MPTTNLFKDLPKVRLEFPAAVGPFDKTTRVEDGGIIGKETTKAVPFQIVEGLDKVLEQRAGCGSGGAGPRIRFLCQKGPREA